MIKPRRLIQSFSLLLVLLTSFALSLSVSMNVSASSLRAPIYKALEEAKLKQEEGKIDEVFAILNRLQNYSGKKALKPYEKAFVTNFTAYAWLAKEDYPKALSTFQALLALDDVPDVLSVSALYTMGQLYLVTEEPKQSIAALKKWFAKVEKPSPDAYVLFAQAYLQLKDFDQALKALDNAFRLAKAQQREEKENWYALLQYIYAEKGNFAKQEDALEVLVDRWPKAQWWLALGGAYAQQEKEAKQLYAMDAAYQQGLFTRGDYIISMSQLLSIQGAPWYAAKAMQKALDQGLVEANFKNLQRLGDYYQRAKDLDKAVVYLQRATELAEDGETSLRLANVYMRQYNYPKAEAFIQKALRQGDLRNALQAKLLLGEVQVYLKAFDKAQKTFASVKQSTQNYTHADGEVDLRLKRLFAQASRWLDYAKREQKRLQALEQWFELNA